MTVTEETEAKVREDREKAIEYADRVMSGEEPWQDEEGDVNDFVPQPDPVEVDAPKNDDVGEKGKKGREVVEVDQDNPAPAPTE